MKQYFLMLALVFSSLTSYASSSDLEQSASRHAADDLLPLLVELFDIFN